MKNKNYVYSIIKRILDLVFSLTLLIALSGPLLLISCLVLFDSKGGIFFKQKRVGKDNTYFQIYKFRTMYIDAPKDAPTDQLDNAKSWITPIGRILRKTSLDELPQLLNILSGSMSFVGPRPALWNQLNLINLRTLNGTSQLVPGLTGWAQTNGRDANDDVEKSILDEVYLKNFGFLMDVKCILWTFKTVIFSTNVIEGKE